MSWNVSVLDTCSEAQQKHEVETEVLDENLFVLRARDNKTGKCYQAHVDSKRCGIITDGLLSLSELLLLIRERFSMSSAQSPRTARRNLREYAKQRSWVSSKDSPRGVATLLSQPNASAVNNAQDVITPNQSLDTRKYMRIRIPWKASVDSQESFEDSQRKVALNFDIFLFEERREHSAAGPSFAADMLRKLDSIHTRPAGSGGGGSSSSSTPLRPSSKAKTAKMQIDTSPGFSPVDAGRDADRSMRSAQTRLFDASIVTSTPEASPRDTSANQSNVYFASVASGVAYNKLRRDSFIRWSGSQSLRGLEIFSRVFHDEEIVFLQSAVYEVLVSAHVPADAASLLEIELLLDGHKAKEAPASSPRFGTPKSAVGAALKAVGSSTPEPSTTSSHSKTTVKASRRRKHVQQPARPRTTPGGRSSARRRRPNDVASRPSTATAGNGQSPSPRLQASGKRGGSDIGPPDGVSVIERKFVVPAARGQSIGVRIKPARGMQSAVEEVYCYCVKRHEHKKCFRRCTACKDKGPEIVLHRTTMNATDARKATGRPHWDGDELCLGKPKSERGPSKMHFTLQIQHHSFDNCI